MIPTAICGRNYNAAVYSHQLVMQNVGLLTDVFLMTSNRIACVLTYSSAVMKTIKYMFGILNLCAISPFVSAISGPP